MRLQNSLTYPLIILTALGFASVLTFQNCAKVQFGTTDEFASKALGDPEVLKPQYVELKAGDKDNFPPLKLIFVIDNSGTMQTNQISLSSAFSKLFEGNNATNLTPFDSTAVVISTAQSSLQKSSNAAAYARLPKLGASALAQMSSADVMSKRGSILDGSIAGDLVGYQLLESTANGLNGVSYLPAPVMNFVSQGGRTEVSLASHKTRDGSVSDFARDFRDRVAVLDPERSAIDSSTKMGVLDTVVDKESGLCALARVVRHKQDFIKSGELAAFIIVSDENDSDPAGRNCIESFNEFKGSEELIDGYCVTPKTDLTFRELNSNPAAANCSVTYDTGFKYKYNYNVSQTTVGYFRAQRDYKVRQTKISYKYPSAYSYSQPKTIFSYFTKSPTYKVPQTKISYYKKVESCESIRDGNKNNCTYTYPQSTTDVIAQSFTDCKAFAAGKIPGDALTGDNAHPVECKALDPVAKTGACAAGDANVLDCKQNYSAAKKDSGAFDGAAPSDQAQCEALAKGKLEASAVISDAGFAISCKAGTAEAKTGTGICPTGVANCSQDVASDSVSVDGIQGAATCSAFATAKKSQLKANANLTSDISCVEDAGRDVKNENGVCSSLSADVAKNCVAHPASSVTNGTYSSVPAAGQSCLDYIKAMVGANVAVAESSNVTCGTPTVKSMTSGEKTIAYTNAAAKPFAASVNANCLSALQGYISTTDKLDATSCTVTALTTGSAQYNGGKTCEQMADPSEKCASSSSTLKNCVASSTQPGDQYKSTLTTQAGLAGTFTCDSLCSETTFCSGKPGTVASNYKDCSVKAASTNRNFTRALASSMICSGNETLKPVETKRYVETGVRADYVAGSESEKGSANALANYIRDEAGSSVVSVSAFVRQPGDPTGANGSIGTAYNSFVDIMGGGQKLSVLGDANTYAKSLESLGGLLRAKLDRSFSVKLSGSQSVHRVWLRKAGTTDWGEPLAEASYKVSGGTVTLASSVSFTYGDEFRFEYY